MRTRTRVTGVLLAAAAVWSPACGDEPDASTSVSALAQGVCSLAFRCCSRGEIAYLLGPFVDELSCADRLTQTAEVNAVADFEVPVADGVVEVPNVSVLERSIAAGRAAVDEEGLEACLDYLRDVPCNQYEEPEEWQSCRRPDPPAENPCDAALIFRGRVGEGGSCSNPGASHECEGGLNCLAVDSFGVEGVCVAPGAEGDYCFDDEECVAALYCSLLDGTCRKPGAEGEACLYADREDLSPDTFSLLLECQAGLHCDPVTDTCVGACERGAECVYDLHCDDEQGLLCILGRCDLSRGAWSPCEETTDCEEGLRCGPSVVHGNDLVCQSPLGYAELCDSSRHEDCESGFCEPSSSRCKEQVLPGGVCPSGLNAQCADGFCETEGIACESNADCVASGQCNMLYGYCEPYCVALRANGQGCTFGFECESDACVSGECRRLPLTYGHPCTADFQCESGFCNFEPERFCDELPMPDGNTCYANDQCASEICYYNVCTAGLDESMDCSSSIGPPCAHTLYCDWGSATPTCMPLLEPGASCESSVQCRGLCTVIHDRYMCDLTPVTGTVVCDGAPQEESR